MFCVYFFFFSVYFWQFIIGLGIHLFRACMRFFPSFFFLLFVHCNCNCSCFSALRFFLSFLFLCLFCVCCVYDQPPPPHHHIGRAP
ncbi:hypothetical protein DFH27DRAFT_555302 [Peziza echinospora]|nr:hypothetical protein DFH27DRAFT_555302 [Peziza echinospora]